MIGSSHIDTAEYRDKVHEISSHILSILKDHCGPNAAYAAWPSFSEIQTVTDTEFSKDGITIIRDRLIYHRDPFANCIRSSIAYLGTRVDAACNDGTTTSMMVLANALATFMSDKYDGFLTKYTQYEINNGFSKIFNLLKTAIEENGLTISDYNALFPNMSSNEARRDIIHCQAMISSKGNHELSEALTEYASRVPFENLYGQYTLDHDVFETKTRLYVKEYDYNIGIPSYFMLQNLYNINLNTDYQKENIDLLAIDEDLLIGSPLTIKLMSDISLTIANLQGNKDPEGKLYEPATYLLRQRDLILFIKNRGDARILEDITLLNETLGKKGYPGRVVLIQLQNPQSTSQYLFLTAVRALAGQITESINEVISGGDLAEYVIHDVNIQTAGNVTRIGNLYKKNKDELYTPYYHNGNRFYNRLLSDIRKFIEDYLNGHSENPEAKKTIGDYLLVYKYLICNNWVTLRMGGATHDLRALKSVVEDTFGATNSSIISGFIFGGYFKLCLKLLMESRKGNFNPVEKEIAQVFYEAISVVLDHTYQKKDFLTNYVDDNLEAIETMYNDTVFHHYYDGTDKDNIKQFCLQDLRDETTNPEKVGLVQPVRGFVELIRRLEEILPRYVLSVRYFISE